MISLIHKLYASYFIGIWKGWREKKKNCRIRVKEEKKKKSKFQFKKVIEKGRRNNGTETKSLVRLHEDSTFEMLLALCYQFKYM